MTFVAAAWTDVVQAVAIVLQSGLLVWSLLLTRRTVEEAERSRRATAEQFESERAADAARAAESHAHERAIATERRLLAVIDRLAALEQLRMEMLQGSSDALLRHGTALRLLQASVVATGTDLPACSALYATGASGIPAPESVSIAMSEIETQLHAVAAGAAAQAA